jgi:AraC-like DNA-binding protein
MWVRTMEAARLLGSDLSITDVAHRAGFADSAHLARTFKRLIGQTPSAAQRGALGVLVIDDPP